MTAREAIATGATEIPYRDTGRRIGGRIVHLASVTDNFDRALCGKLREQPLEPNAQGEICVVCKDLYIDRYGKGFGE